MKRKLLFAMATLFAMVGVQQIKADTALLPESNGWTKVTSVPTATDIANNYYVFVDTNNDLMLGVGKGVNNNTKWYTLGVFYYTSVSPTSNDILSKTWTLETNGDGFALRNLEYSALCIQTEWSQAWKFNTNDVATPNDWAKYTLAYADGSWTIQGGHYPEAGYVGPWKDSDFTNGAECAGNKTGDNVGKFQLYAISRETYKANLMAAASATNPIDVTPWYVTNATFDLGNRSGWTDSGSGGNNNTSYGGGCEIWHRSGANVYQTITVPAGMYKVSVQASGSTSGTVYGTSGSTTVTANISVGNDGDFQNNCLLMIKDRNRARITTEELAVASGSLTIGFKDETANQWDVFDNFKLYYTGPITDLTPYVDAWMEALAAAKATAATTEEIAPSVLSSLNTTITTYDEGQVDEASQAALEEATAALKAANTRGQKSIASYAVIAQGFVPDNSLDGWVCENTQNFVVNTWSVEGNPGNDPSGMVTPFIQNWTGKGGLLGAGKVYYRLEGLEPGGVYRVSALVRSYNEASADAPNGPNFYVLDDVADLTEVGTTFTYNNMSGIYGTQTAAAKIGEDGVLELGVIINENRNYNWVAFKNIQISTFDAALEAAVAEVEALNGKVPAATYTDVAQAAIDACQGENYPTTAEAFEQAIERLNATVVSLQPMVELYAAYLELNDYADALVAAPTDNTEAQSPLNTAITTAATDIEAATDATTAAAVNTALRTAMDTYAAAANPTDEAQPFNLTYKFVNPNLEGLPTWKPCAGWYTEQPDGNSQVMTNDAATSEDGTKTAFYEYWSYTAKSNNLFTLYQPVTLPEGTYSMSCYAFAKQQDDPANTGDVVGVYFYANDTQGSAVSTDRLSAKTIEFVNATEQEVKIGLKAINPNSYNWMGIGYLELYKIPAKSYTIDCDDEYDYTQKGAGDVTVKNRPIKVGYNTVVFPFSMTQAEVEEVFGAESKVSVIKSYDAENDNLKFTKQADGIRANAPCLVKATVARDGDDYFILADRTVIASETILPTTIVDGVQFIGTYEGKTDLQENDWFVKNGYLVYAGPTGGCWVNMTRAFLRLPASSDVKALKFTFEDGDDVVTGIATLENGKLNIRTGKAYDLSGREVKNPTKGLYIIDGKKVFLK